MNYYAAPMEGLTDRIWRQVHQKWFGAAMPPRATMRVPVAAGKPRPHPEKDGGAGPGGQCRHGRDPAAAGQRRRTGRLDDRRSAEAGLHGDQPELRLPLRHGDSQGQGSRDAAGPRPAGRFLDAVFSAVEGPVSVKTRIGVQKPEEFAALLDIYNRYPICELTIHPRVMKQLYRGEADRAAFAAALPECRMPVCYNGDVTTPEELHALEAEFPQLSGDHGGAGAHRRPSPVPPCAGRRTGFQRGTARLLRRPLPRYTEAFGAASCAVSRMKAHWFYLIHRFEGADPLEKPLRKAREGWEYETVVNQIFTRQLK